MNSNGLLQVRVRNIRWEAEGIASYELESPDGADLPAFEAGAHVDLHLPQGMVRSYSLANAPSERRRYRIAVEHQPQGRGGSAWIHSTLRVGEILRICAPINDFPLVEGSSESVFIAGGIGITPMLPMLYRLNELELPWRLHYAARSPHETAFLEELRGLEQPRSQVEFCFGSTRVARLDVGAIIAAAPQDAHLYCCGPARLIDDFLVAAAARPAAQVHLERFAASTEAATGGGFEVLLRRSGRRLAVAQGKTILDVLLDHDVDVQYSCSSGVCGSCRTGVIDGEPDHRDDFLSDEEKQANRSIMVCCSGSRSRTLVLDL